MRYWAAGLLIITTFTVSGCAGIPNPFKRSEGLVADAYNAASNAKSLRFA